MENLRTMEYIVGSEKGGGEAGRSKKRRKNDNTGESSFSLVTLVGFTVTKPRVHTHTLMWCSV